MDMADSAPETPPPPQAATSAPPADGRAASEKRRKLFTLLGGAVAVAAIIAGLYWLLIGRNYVTTDDAYVDADTAEITPLVSGQVTQVLAGDTDYVRRGQLLVSIDPSDFKVAVDQAEAQLGQAERKVRGYYSNNDALSGQVASRAADIVRADAQITSAQSDLDRARTELGRRERLAASGAVSGDELTDAQNQFNTAQAALAQAKAAKAQALADKTAAEGARDVNQALIQGSDVDTNPEVAAARANLAQAELNLQRTALYAPVDGVVAKKDVSVGQRVQAGSSLMVVVPIDTAYVNANFKEVQLRRVRVGQPVTLTSDLHGGGVKYHGVVAGLAGGTGAAFSLIPAQNATGNWIKIVQRLPVRVEIDPKELREHPLFVGLSMKATVNVAH